MAGALGVGRKDSGLRSFCPAPFLLSLQPCRTALALRLGSPLRLGEGSEVAQAAAPDALALRAAGRASGRDCRIHGPALCCGRSWAGLRRQSNWVRTGRVSFPGPFQWRSKALPASLPAAVVTRPSCQDLSQTSVLPQRLRTEEKETPASRTRGG